MGRWPLREYFWVSIENGFVFSRFDFHEIVCFARARTKSFHIGARERDDVEVGGEIAGERTLAIKED